MGLPGSVVFLLNLQHFSEECADIYALCGS